MWYAKLKNIRDFVTTTPAKSVFFGYLTYCLFGSLILWLPISRHVPVSFVDNLFTAISAVSTTGLTTLSISDSYTF